MRSAGREGPATRSGTRPWSSRARAGLAPVAELPWEFAARIRSALQPVLALGALAGMRAIGVTSPYPWVLALRLGALALAFAVLLHMFAHVAPARTRRARQTLWLVGLFLWFTPLFTSRFTSENLGGLALGAALPFLERQPRIGRDVWVGVLLGLSFVLRFQMAFAVGALLLWLGVCGPGGWPRAARVALCALAMVGLGVLVDRWFYEAWVFTPWEYLRTNLLEGVATSFGTSPPYAYLLWAPLWMAPPLGIALVGLIATAVLSRPGNPWVWAFVAFLFGHSLIAHKELRFLLPLLYLVPVLVALGIEAIERSWPRGARSRLLAGALLAQNALLALLLATPAIHRGKDFDWHYYRFLWETAESHLGATILVLDEDGSLYQTADLDVNVYRHPRVRAADSLPSLVARGAATELLLVMTRRPGTPRIDAIDLELACQAEPGYRIMARSIGVQDRSLIARLESVDCWTDSEWVRRVYRIRAPRPLSRPGVP